MLAAVVLMILMIALPFFGKTIRRMIGDTATGIVFAVLVGICFIGMYVSTR